MLIQKRARRKEQKQQSRKHWCVAVHAMVWSINAVAVQLPESQSLTSLSLEELSNVEITSVSKRPEKLSDAAASIYVISNEAIRRSGATSLPEALRLAPNLEVARINASQYAISARGFNTTTANKLLVLMDGRTLYTPLYSGMFWDAQSVVLADVERIEVISGPGATLWGANAVNGVINIITRSAEDTQGGLVSVGAGDLERNVSVRQGGQWGNHGFYRIYGKFSDLDNSHRGRGTSVNDGWRKAQIGFRGDWERGDERATLQGDVYSGQVDQTNLSTGSISGGNLLGRWSRDLSASASVQWQAYYDRTQRDYPNVFSETLDTFDLEFQHRFAPATGHRLVWGAGYRYSQDQVTNSTALAFLPARKALHWSNLFVQDEISLPHDLRLTLGSKFQHNDYTGLEFLPSVRLAWKLNAEQLFWGALSRAVREPSRIDRDFYAPAQAPYQLAGGANFRSEISNTLELGYRAQPSKIFSYSVTTFYSRYQRLRSLESIGGNSFVIDNKIGGNGSGVEAWANYQASASWRLFAGVTLLRQRLRLDAGSTAAPSSVIAEGNDPAHIWTLRSSYDISEKHELDISVRRIAALPNPAVPAYTAVDVRYGWRVRPDLDLSLTVQNLFDPGHPEFGAAATRSQIERGAYLKLVWRI